MDIITKVHEFVTIDQPKNGESEMLYIKKIMERYEEASVVIILSPEILVSEDPMRKKIVETRGMTVYKLKKSEEIKK